MGSTIDMSVKERFKEAFEQVAFNADQTWLDTPNSYQKSNLKLYSLGRHLEKLRESELPRPRTVQESIPTSRLAVWTNAVYDESREMCYVPSTSKPSFVPCGFPPTEPWEFMEVDYAFYSYFRNEESTNMAINRSNYDSPFMNTEGFQDKLLKIQITEDRIKDLWRNAEQERKKDRILVNVYFSPMQNYYLFQNDIKHDPDWFKSVSTQTDLVNLEKMMDSFKTKTNDAEKYVRESTASSGGTSLAESASSDVLYSEVLQGISRKVNKTEVAVNTTKLISNEQPSSKPFATSVETSETFTNFTILNRPTSSQTTTNKLETKNFRIFPITPKLPAFLDADAKGRIAPYLQPGSPPSHKFGTAKENGGVFVVESQSLPNVAAAAPIGTTKSAILAPNQEFLVAQSQRLANAANIYYPNPAQQVYNPNHQNLGQLQLVSGFGYDCNRQLSVQRTPPAREPPDFSSNLNSKRTTNINVNNGPAGEATPTPPGTSAKFPFSASTSEELELQALEQYTSSNENFYKELERQAAEQYSLD